MSKTNFGQLKIGEYVNLEQALRLDQGLDGHLVTGHVNSCGKVSKIENLGESWLLEIYVSKLYMKYLCPEGSVAINGVSLTVNEVKDLSFNAYIIPHTWKNTNLCFLKIGDLVNLEFDILAKYLEKLLVQESRFDKYKASLSEFFEMIYTKEEILDDIKNGVPLIITDDESRENEGDFFVSAKCLNQESLLLMLNEGRGLICAPMSSSTARKLNLSLMVNENSSNHSTAFTVSVDHKGNSTGISARDRLETLRELANPESVAEDFVRQAIFFH